MQYLRQQRDQASHLSGDSCSAVASPICLTGNVSCNPPPRRPTHVPSLYSLYVLDWNRFQCRPMSHPRQHPRHIREIRIVRHTVAANPPCTPSIERPGVRRSHRQRSLAMPPFPCATASARLRARASPRQPMCARPESVPPAAGMCPPVRSRAQDASLVRRPAPTACRMALKLRQSLARAHLRSATRCSAREHGTISKLYVPAPLCSATGSSPRMHSRRYMHTHTHTRTCGRTHALTHTHAHASPHRPVAPRCCPPARGPALASAGLGPGPRPDIAFALCAATPCRPSRAAVPHECAARATMAAAGVWSISPELRQYYGASFASLGPVGGMLAGAFAAAGVCSFRV